MATKNEPVLALNSWAFEAYQTAAQLAAQYQLALILRDSLERGDMPQAMPE